MKKLPWKRLLSLLLTLAFMIQLLPLDVFAAEISETTTTEEQLISTAVEVSEAISPTVVGEVEELRTEDGKQFRMSDGSYMAVSYGMPVHFQETTGQWTDIDNTLENITTSDGTAALVSTNGSASTSFAGNLSSGQVFSAAYGTQNISISMLDAATAQQLVTEYNAANEGASAGILSNTSSDLATFSRTATATVVPADTTISAETEEQAEIMAAVYPETLESAVLYEDVYPGVDLLYNLTGYNIKESIIVNEPLDSYHFTFLLELDGLTPQMQEDGSIHLVDENNQVIWLIPAPYMFDAQNNTSGAVEYTLTSLGTAGALLTIEADATWINSTERTFPVTIDPTFYKPVGDAYGDIYATYVEQGNNTSHGHFQQLYLGYTAYQSLGERWIYLHFNNLPQIPQGSIVVNAALNLWQFDYSHGNCPELPVGAYEVTSDKASDETYHDWIYYMKWSDKATYDSANMIDYATASEATDDGYLSWDLTELFNKWYDTGTENRTLALVPTDTGKFSSSYYGIPVFYAYGQNHPPILMVSYRNNTGIEPYYTYQTMGAGHAGTAYIADYSGQLTVAKELFSLASTVNPFSIQMVYNSAYFSQTTDSQYDLCADLGMEMHVGSGWTYNFLQHVKEDTIDGVPYIRYLDGDGTIHYFAQDSSKEEGYFYDEDGLGLKINEYYDNYYSMTDDHGNEWVFVRGHLLWIKDSNGNRIQIEYSQNGTETTSHYPPSTGARIERIYQQNVGQSRVDIATFHYTTEKLPGKTQDEADDIPVPNYLSSIEDGAGNTYSFAYNHGKLSSILYNGQEIAHYSMWYNNGYYQNQMDAMTDVEAGYSLNFSYTNHRVSAVEETADVTVSGGDLSTGEDGVRIEIGRTDDGWTVYTDPGADRITGTSDDLHTYYGFDHFGRTVNGYTTDASDNIIGASNAVYSGTGSTDRTNNRTMRTASIGVAAQQELQNFGFESVDGWSRQSSGGASSALATTLPRTGARSLRFTIPDSSTDAYSYAYKSSNTLQADTTYILSAYINTSQATAFNGDGLYLKVQDTTGNVWTSDCLNYQTSSLVDDGWVRISLAFTAEVQGAHTVTIYNDTICGNSYVDDLQLEKTIGFVTGTDEETGATQTSTSAVSNVNLLENGNMQGTNGWTMNAGSAYVTGCGVQSTATSARSVKVTGNPTADNHASQTVNLNLPSDQTYVLSGWAMANAVPDNVMEGDPETDKDAAGKDTNKQFGLRAIVRYDGIATPEYHYIPFNPDLSGWQFTSLTIVPRRQKEQETDPDIIVASIEVQCAYEKNGNTAWFDNLSLVREAAQTMKYDEKGNLVSVTTTGVKADTDSFDENNNLIQTVTGGNGTYHYTYDETYTHRLTAVSNEIVVQNLSYDSVGNVIQTVLEKDLDYADAGEETDGLKFLVSSSSYTSNKNLVESVTDTTGQTEKYTYGNETSVMTGQATSVEDANGTITNTTYDFFARIKKKEIDDIVKLEYTYTEGILSGVLRTDSTGKAQTYAYNHDHFGNLTDLAVGNITLAEYTYAPQNGYLLEQSYGNGDSVTFEYDNLGRTVRSIYSSGRVLSYTYTGDGQMHTITDNNFTDDTTADDYTYCYTYDTLGRIVNCQMRKGIQVLLQTHWEYDDCSRVQSQGWQMGTSSYKETYTYSEVDGSLTGVAIDGTAKDLALAYDYLQRLTTVSTDVYVKTYDYKDLEDNRTTSQIQRLVYKNTGDNTQRTFAYTYNTLGNIETYTGNGEEPLTYHYDSLGQLTSVNLGATDEDGSALYTYTYDTVGNILTAQYAAWPEAVEYRYENTQWRDLLTKYNGGAIAYEGQTYNAETNTASGDPISGNPISYFNGTRWNLAWAEGRNLVSASTSTDTQDIEVSFTYDSNGLRTSKTVTYTTTEEEEHTHEYAETVVEATCTEDGYTMYTCSCGDSYLEDIVDALGHNYVESETETGTVFTCSRCGDSYTGHTHSYTSSVTTPTCTETGYTTYTCSCGDSYTGNNVDALGHNYVQSGDVYTCSRCGDSYSGHQHTYTETVTEPDCERDGYTTYTCSCGYSYTDNIVPALGHDLVLLGQVGTTATYACTRCGYSYTVTVPVNPNPPSEEYSLRRSTVSVVTEYHEYIYASGKLLREVITTTDAEGNVSTQTLDFQYDNVGFPYALTYINGTANPATYYYITNMQGDVVYLVDEQGQEVAYYTYDPFGKVLTAEGDMAEVNPLRYRGYFYDDVTGFYYLQSRYYDPAICRYINADSYLSTGQGFLGYNAFAYCANNPVNYTDSSGNFFDTVFDVISIAFSVAEVIANPCDPWAWAGLAGDIVDLVPFVSGVGETVKAVAVVAKTADVAADVHKAAKAAGKIDNLVDAAKAVSKVSGPASKLRKATGSYEIIYKSGKNYVGKGGFKRAIQSALEHAKPNKLNDFNGDEILSIEWTSASNHLQAFLDEYARMGRRGVRNLNTYNQVWSPGRTIYRAIMGELLS